MMSEEKEFINVAAMFKDVKSSFKKLVCSDDLKPHLINALNELNPNNISPGPTQIFEFAKYCELDDINVVIVGQDPYPNPDHAHGLCFSSRDSKIPASLKNIYKCLEHHGHIQSAKEMDTAYLESWAHQGVLMMNMALTTTLGKAGAHLSRWEPLTKKIIAHMGSQERPVVFLLWGGYATKMRGLITSKSAIILEETHPSPMAQARLSEDKKFTNCDHFNKVNECLVSQNKRPIDWNPKPKHIVYTDGSGNNTADANSKAGYATYFQSGPLKGVMLWGRLTIGTIFSHMKVAKSDSWDMNSNPMYVDQYEDETQSEKETFGSSIGGGYLYEGKKHVTKDWKEPLSVTLIYGADRDMIFPTSQRGEGMAILMALERVISFRLRADVEIVTDSKFWKTMIEEWIPKWRDNHIPFTARKNPDLVTRIWRAVIMVKDLGTLTIRHIYSHDTKGKTTEKDKRFNDLCDEWANKGRTSDEFGDFESIC
jgi:uracil-DNA glycosylase